MNIRLFIIFTLLAIITFINLARGQEPVIIPVGISYRTIKPFYEHKVIIEAHINDPKNISYCPLRDGDYQCPIEEEKDNPPEKE